MATSKSKSRARPSRNPAQFACTQPRSIQDAIETERARLMSAEAVLHCVVVAMDESEIGDAQAPDYQGAIEVARELLVQAIDQLDSVRVQSLLRVGGKQRAGVKESEGEYLLH